jgi:hypothetical protein
VHNVMICCPSRAGIHPYAVSSLFNLRMVIAAHGHKPHWATLYRIPLDVSRNELMTVFLSSTCDLMLAVDDDCWIEPILDPQGIMLLLDAADNGCDIVSAPCRMRDTPGGTNNPFNIQPISQPFVVGATRVVEIQWSGFGCILIRREVLEKLHADALNFDADLLANPRVDVEPRTYASQVMPGRTSSSIFKTVNTPASTYVEGAPAGLNVPALDDKAFCLKAREAGFKIHAAIDVRTNHDGMEGCFAEEMAKLQAAREAERASIAAGNSVGRGSGLVDNMGRPLR